MSKESQKPDFGTLRSIFWPIYRHELVRLIPMMLMLFFICVNYSIIRNVKDTIIIVTTDGGAEVLPFIKVWALLPMAFFFTWLFARLTNRFSREVVFHVMVGLFLSYFLTFTFVLYPRLESLRLDTLANLLLQLLPRGALGFIEMVRHWPSTLFYVMAELWATIVMSILFWGLANQVTLLPQAKRFYGVLNVASALSAFAAGQVAIFLSGEAVTEWIPFGSTPWESTLGALMITITTGSAVVLLSLRWMTVRVLNVQDELEKTAGSAKKKKPSLSIRRSFLHLARSKYLRSIALMVVAYNLCINLMEVIWKAKLKEMLPDAQAFNIYLNSLTSMMGLISASTALFIPLIISRIGWTFMAMITPVIMFVTTAGFFFFQFVEISSVPGLVLAFANSPLALVVLFGSAANMLSKAAKYSVFDASKELAFIPLPDDARLTGKAAIDGVGSRFGKSGGSILQQGLLLLFGSLSACVPWIAGIMTLCLGAWAMTTLSLGRSFNELTGVRESEEENKESVVTGPVKVKQAKEAI